MKKEIKITPDERKRIASVYKVTPQSVGRALRFERNSPLAESIRNDALMHGGKLLEITEVETPAHRTKILDSKGQVVRTITR